MKKKGLTHIDNRGQAKMVDISAKASTERNAAAWGRVRVSKKLLKLLGDNSLAKGDALATARIAGIQAAKRVGELIPLCHTLPLSFAGVEFKLLDNPSAVEITATVRANYKTGVEMEALTAVSMAALTIYDMCKSVDKGITIEQIQLLEKSGGRSGKWKRKKSDGR